MAYFSNYEQDKGFWFYLYLEWAATICHYPELSAKYTAYTDILEAYAIAKNATPYNPSIGKGYDFYGTNGKK